MGKAGIFHSGSVARRWLALASVLGAVAFGSAPLHAGPAGAPPAVETSLRSVLIEADLAAFYAARQHRPLWFDTQGQLNPAARSFLELARTAEIDGTQPELIGLPRLTAAVERAERENSPAALAQAEALMSESFAAYAAALLDGPARDMLYEHVSMRGPSLPRRALLETAAAAPSLSEFVQEMGWMHPLYAPLRWAAATTADESARLVLANNLERVRAVPANPAKRYILVDAASARLWMYEGRRAVDSMKVVVGKPVLPTPMIAGYIRHAIVNPYWNVPQDLIREKIAPNVLRSGPGYLKAARYEVLSDWTGTATPIDPGTVNWKQVAAGNEEVRVRQLPSSTNAMGRVKYEFPNKLGIYLHDTPDKDLMLKSARQFSSGCIRLEDAERLGVWLLNSPLPEGGSDAETKVPLPEPVPVYVTYLTAFPSNGQIALGPDPYRKDANGAMLADLGSSDAALRR